MKLLKTSLIVMSVLGLSLMGGWQALAAKTPDLPDVVDDSGLYNEPGRPDVKVRVFVHGPKPVKAPALVCNLADPTSSAVVPAAGWKLASQVTYRLNTRSVPASVGSGNLPTLVDNGFDDWSAAVNGDVVFTRGTNTTVSRSAYDGQNVIAWGRTSGQALGVTYIRYMPSTGEVVDVDTIMNAKFKWSWSTSTACADSATYDAENIMTHELGHWMGLDDTYTSPFLHNTMYGYGAKGEVKKNTLTNGDILGAQAIY